MTLVHPTAYVPEQVELADGVFVGARAVIQPFATIGPASIINTGAIVEHHCVLGANVHAAPGSILCGHVSVGAHSLIGAGATVIQSCRLGEAVTVGAGAVVTRDVADNQILVSAEAVNRGSSGVAASTLGSALQA
jgi:sugar O-acyltransferase (sialic acid O-acetyltransferase NeuD family)